MDITPLIKEGQQIIQSYAGGQFKVSGHRYDHALIVEPAHTVLWDAPQDFSSFSKANFQPLIARADQIDVVLLGSGSAIQFFPPMLRQELRTHGIMVDVMDTGAACRTYNVLMAEGRRVAAALLLS